MQNQFLLVMVGRDTFIMRNPGKDLKNYQCNSKIFDNPDDARKDISVFSFFGVKISGLPDIGAEKLDFRTKRAKYLKNRYPFFSAAFLPEISRRAKGPKFAYIKASFSK